MTRIAATSHLELARRYRSPTSTKLLINPKDAHSVIYVARQGPEVVETCVLVKPNDLPYDEMQSVYNGMIDKRPAVSPVIALRLM